MHTPFGWRDADGSGIVGKTAVMIRFRLTCSVQLFFGRFIG